MGRKTWKEVLRKAPVVLPAAHDALTARLIEQAGFDAYQIGGFALTATQFGVPDMGLTCYGEESEVIRKITQASNLPVLVDADDGYGDAKNVTRMIQGYEQIGVSALFFEDQKAPKRCGHLPGKELMPVEAVVSKLKAALDARKNEDTFILARTDAIAVDGVEEALERANLFLDAGVDGIYVEAPETEEDLAEVGEQLGHIPLAVSYMTGGGKMPWFSPKELHKMGYSMVLYSTALLFPMIKALQKALKQAKQGKDPSNGISMDEFSEVIGIPSWSGIEETYPVE